MADLMDIIKGRRSIRKYQDKDIPEALLNQILESVQWAPSWANTQCWEVIVVKDPGVKETLAEVVPKSNPARKHFTEAPAILVLCGKLGSSGYYGGKVTTKFGPCTFVATPIFCWAKFIYGQEFDSLDTEYQGGDLNGRSYGYYQGKAKHSEISRQRYSGGVAQSDSGIGPVGAVLGQHPVLGSDCGERPGRQGNPCGSCAQE